MRFKAFRALLLLLSPLPACVCARAQGNAADVKMALQAHATVSNNWIEIGPEPDLLAGFHAGAMVFAIAIDPRNSNVVYVGSPSGGVWKTTDGGDHFKPLTDTQPSMSIGAIVLDPKNPDTVYASTGQVFQGNGILKSTDGGETWTNIVGPFSPFDANGQPNPGTYIYSLAINSANSQILLAGLLRFPESTSGVFRSTDGGATWTQVLSGGRVFSVTSDPTDPSIAYAGISEPVNPQATGVYKSTDSGATWRLLPNSPHTQAAIFLAQSPAAPNTLWMNTNVGGVNGLYRSSDGGNTWIPLSVPPVQRSMSALAVHPVNPRIIMAGAEFLYRSLDGGATWALINFGENNTRVFGDIRTFAFSSDASLMWVGDDGGAHSTHDAANPAVTWTNHNDTLAITQVLHGLSSQGTDPNVMFIGTQDEGIQKYGGTLLWRNTYGCDGVATLIDYKTPSIVYAVCNSPHILKSTQSGEPDTFSEATNGINQADSAASRYPLAMDPNNPAILYTGTNRVYRSADGAQSWVPISPALGRDVYQGVSTLGLASDGKTAYAGILDGSIYVTNNVSADPGNVIWANRSSGIPFYTITSFAVDTLNPAVAYVALEGSRSQGTPGGHVFKTVNAGLQWTDISAGLPNMAVLDILVVPGTVRTLYVATHTGVYSSTDDGSTWTRFGAGLPLAHVTGLSLYRPKGLLRAGTYGRGVWQTSIEPGLPGDLNGDGFVDCDDIAIVRAAFGKKKGQPGFDDRADVVVDGLVNVRDVAYVSQHLAAGTRCQ